MSLAPTIAIPRSEALAMRETIVSRSRVPPDGCWLWEGTLDGNGYGILTHKRRNLRAHRVSYVAFVDEIPSGLVLHHTCEVPACVNPAHLVPMDNIEHRIMHQEAAPPIPPKTHCDNGHEFTPENTRIEHRKNASTRRVCRTCNMSRWTAWKARRVAERTA